MGWIVATGTLALAEQLVEDDPLWPRSDGPLLASVLNYPRCVRMAASSSSKSLTFKLP